MIFKLIRQLRRRRFKRRPMDPEWVALLEKRVPFFAKLDVALQPRFLERVKLFVWEKTWIAAGGMTITDEVRVVIAAAAVRLALHLDESVYDRLSEIIVYPTHYHHPGEKHIVLGEAQQWGTMVLSWDAVLGGFINPVDGHDTATHEFAHILDRNSGSFNGTPLLRSESDYRPWALILSHHFARLRDNQQKEGTLLGDYAATNEAEFFAVATEVFFEKPQLMAGSTPDLYRQLSRFYGFDPANTPPV